MNQIKKQEKRNPNKIGKRKFKIEKLYIQETDEEIDNFNIEEEESLKNEE